MDLEDKHCTLIIFNPPFDLGIRTTMEEPRGKKPLIYNKEVDSSKVNLEVIKYWIEEKLSQQLPGDDIAAGFIYELVAGEEHPDILAIENQMDDFLGKQESRVFCKTLWKHLLSAQEDKDGIPEELIEQRRRLLEEKKQAAHESSKYYKSERNRGWYQRDRRDRFPSRGRQGNQRSNKDDHRKSSSSRKDPKKTNYNRSSEGKLSKRDQYEEDHHDARERGPRDRTLL